jgi:hypothetical protein
MMVRGLTSTGDWTFGSGLNNYLSGVAAVSQLIQTRLNSYLGNCFFDATAGIDWFNFLGSKNELALQLAISSTILNTENVTAIVSVTSSLNDETRAYSVQYIVSTVYGTVEGSVTQTMGVGPVSSPSSLLPQFNMTLLNNATATPITGAIFSSGLYWGVDLSYFIEIRTSTQNFIQRGVLLCQYNVDTSSWALTNNVLSGSSGPSVGVTFSINSVTGQVSYASDNVTGSSYVGNLIIGSTNTFLAGI